MQTIEVADEIYWTLNALSRAWKISISDVIAKYLSDDVNPNVNGDSNHSSQSQLTGRDKELSDHLKSQQFLVCRAVVDRFLSILAFAFKKDSKNFGTVTAGMGGRSRKYIAATKEQLEQSGTSVNPKPIPGSPLWVVTNNSTENKKQLIEQALSLLGYGSEAVKTAKESLS